MDKKIFSLTIACVILAACLAVSLISNITVQTDESKFKQLESDKQKLQKSIDQLEGEKQTLQNTITKLESEKQGLQNTINQLRSSSKSSSSSSSGGSSSSSSQSSDTNRINQLESEKQALQNTINQLNSEKQTLQNTITKLESEKQTLQNTINQLQSTINQLTNEKQTIQNTVQELQDIIDLAKSRSIVNNYPISQPAGGSNSFIVDTPYAGYIYVRINTSGTNLAYARVSYTSNGGKSPNTIRYDQRVTNLASGSVACFPVLPGNTTVYIGNTNTLNSASHTVTIEYWY